MTPIYTGCTCYGLRKSADCPHHGEQVIPPKAGPDRNPPPAHYGGTIEPWDYWAAHNLDAWEANAVKYITRAGRKSTSPAVDDYRKARDYLDYLIRREEQK